MPKSKKNQTGPTITSDTPKEDALSQSPLKTAKAQRKNGKEPETMDDLLSQMNYTPKGFHKGQVVEGKVLLVSHKMLLLDIGGKSEAIVHEKEMPYISDLVSELNVGDMIAVHVVNTENDRGQAVVSLRRTAMSKRWEMLEEKMKSGTSVEVTIRELTRGGFLVDYAGLRGFIPLSQVQPEFARHAERATGRHISVKIIEIEKDANRLVFSQIAGGISEKQNEALKKVEIGGTYQGEVTGIAPFGAFVSVKIDDITLPGLIHISEIAWEKVEKPDDYLKVGQTVEVKAIGADPKIGKLTLSLKQLLQDPWEDVTKVFSVDQTVKGKVTRMSQFGAFISLLPGIEGLVHISKIAPGEEPKVGQEVDCVIEEISPERRKVSLSFVAHAKPIGYR